MRIYKVIGFGLVIVLFLGFVVSLRKNTAPEPIIVSVPQITPYQLNAPVNVRFEPDTAFSLPPVGLLYKYSATKIDSLSFINTLLKRFSFETKITENIYTGGKTISWSAPDFSLLFDFSETSASVAYSDAISGPGGILRDELISLILTQSPQLTIKPLGSRQVTGAIHFPYKSSFGLLTNHIYSFSFNGASVLLHGPEEQTLSVFSDPTGRVRYFTLASPIDKITQQKQVTAIRSEDVFTNLNSGKGVFVSYKNNTWEIDNPALFTSVLLQSGALAYLYNQTAQELVPVYLLDGVGFSDNDTVTVRYLLQAFGE